MKLEDLSKLYSSMNTTIGHIASQNKAGFFNNTQPVQHQEPHIKPLKSSSQKDMFDLRDSPAANQKEFDRLRSDFDNFVVYVQKYIEEHLNVLQRIVRAEYRSVEEKMDTIEWAVRYADFISNDEI